MIEIRAAEMKDIDELAELYSKNSPKSRRPLNKYPLADWIISKTSVFLLAEAPKAPNSKTMKKLGFIVVRPKGEEATIDLLYVSKTNVKGVYGALIRHAESLLVGKEVMTVYVSKKNKTMMDVLRENNFKVHDMIKNMYGKNADGMLLIKKISASPSLIPLKKRTTRIPSVLERNLENLGLKTESIDTESDEPRQDPIA